MEIVVAGVGSQPALSAGLTAVSGFVKTFDSHRIGLKEILNGVAVSTIKLSAQISPSKSGEITHHIDEKLRVKDATVLIQPV